MRLNTYANEGCMTIDALRLRLAELKIALPEAELEQLHSLADRLLRRAEALTGEITNDRAA